MRGERGERGKIDRKMDREKVFTGTIKKDMLYRIIDRKGNWEKRERTRKGTETWKKYIYTKKVVQTE